MYYPSKTGLHYCYSDRHGRDRHGRDRMVVGFTTTYTTSAYHHLNCDYEFRSWRNVLEITLYGKVCQ